MDWTSATIIMSTLSDGINSSTFSTQDKQAVFLHELGHALKLKHPHDNTEYWHPVSIMNQGVPQGMDYIPSRPSGYDMYNLQRKW